MKKILFLTIVLLQIIPLKSQSFADGWEYVGIAVEEPGYTIWGSSPIMDEDGKVHLFVARWPGELKVDPGWRSHSEIAHYIGNTPEGPFKFSDIALKAHGKKYWDAYGPHNPAIHKVGEMYYLLYIANNNPKSPYHPSNQQIGLAKSKNLDGPWKRVHGDGLILSPPDNPDYWNYKPSNGVNNPALLQHPDGGFFLYFKSEGGKMGLAIAEHIEGPYVQMPYPVTYNDRSVEDGYAFMKDGRFCLLTTDNHGMIEKGGGILWSSDDGIRFTDAEKGFHPVVKYLDSSRLSGRLKHYGGNIVKFERPQVLLINDKPEYMYAPSGYHFFGKDATASYVLKRTKSESESKNETKRETQNLKVISYNIWNGFDWGKDTARLRNFTEWLHEENADVVALQELCGYNEARLRKEAKMWGHNYVALLKESGYSVGLTSKKPIVIKDKIFEGLHHGALHAETFGIDFLVIHLHPGSAEFRSKEVPILLKKLTKIRQETNKYLVLGDFNEQSPLDAEMYNDDNTFGNGRAVNYNVLSAFMRFPLVDLVNKANQPINERGSSPGLVLSPVQKVSIESLRNRMHRIDFIMASPALARKMKSAGVMRNKTTDWLSDHYPVSANFSL